MARNVGHLAWYSVTMAYSPSRASGVIGACTFSESIEYSRRLTNVDRTAPSAPNCSNKLGGAGEIRWQTYEYFTLIIAHHKSCQTRQKLSESGNMMQNRACHEDVEFSE